MESSKLTKNGQRLFELWQERGECYRKMLPTYFELLEQKRQARPKMRLDSIPKARLKEFPEIPLLRIENEDFAIYYIASKNDEEIRYITNQILNLKFDYTYSTLYERIKQYRYELGRRDKACCKFGDSPNFPSRMKPAGIPGPSKMESLE